MMYMATRTQIYLTDEQRSRLAERAQATGLPMSQLIRDAVDTYLAGDDDFDAAFGSAPGLANRMPSRSDWERLG